MQNTQLFDIAIVGGGIMGLATLYHLATSTNLRVALFEQARLGDGSTHKSGGFVRAFHTQRKQIEWSAETLRFLRQYSKETAFSAIGSYYFADGIEQDTLMQSMAILDEVGESAQLYSGKSIVEQLPQLLPGKRQSLVYEPNAGYADPLKTGLLYAELAKQAGAVIFEYAEVSHIELGTHLSLHVNDSVVMAKAVSLNLGAWSPEFLGKLGLPCDVFKKGIQADTYLVNDGDFPPFCVLDYQSDLYTRPIGRNQQLIGISTQKYDVDLNRDHSSDPKQRKACQIELETLFQPVQDQLKAMGGRIGFDGYRKELIGRIYLSDIIPNLCISEGWSGVGFKMAHGVGLSTMNTILSVL
jgi:sarcosine oxidase subunit beta